MESGRRAVKALGLPVLVKACYGHSLIQVPVACDCRVCSDGSSVGVVQ